MSVFELFEVGIGLSSSWNDGAYPASVRPEIQRRREGILKRILDRVWDAQVRPCCRYRRLATRGKNVNIAVVAVARELAGFIWDISELAISLAVTRDERPA